MEVRGPRETPSPAVRWPPKWHRVGSQFRVGLGGQVPPPSSPCSSPGTALPFPPPHSPARAQSRRSLWTSAPPGDMRWRAWPQPAPVRHPGSLREPPPQLLWGHMAPPRGGDARFGESNCQTQGWLWFERRKWLSFGTLESGSGSQAWAAPVMSRTP